MTVEISLPTLENQQEILNKVTEIRQNQGSTNTAPTSYFRSGMSGTFYQTSTPNDILSITGAGVVGHIKLSISNLTAFDLIIDGASHNASNILWYDMNSGSYTSIYSSIGNIYFNSSFILRARHQYYGDSSTNTSQLSADSRYSISACKR